MSQLKILTNNVADIATITVANTAAGMGALNGATQVTNLGTLAYANALAAEEFTPGMLEAINTQLVHLGLTMNQIVENE